MIGTINGAPVNLYAINVQGTLPVRVANLAILQDSAASASAAVVATVGASALTQAVHTLASALSAALNSSAAYAQDEHAISGDLQAGVGVLLDVLQDWQLHSSTGQASIVPALNAAQAANNLASALTAASNAAAALTQALDTLGATAANASVAASVNSQAVHLMESAALAEIGSSLNKESGTQGLGGASVSAVSALLNALKDADMLEAGAEIEPYKAFLEFVQQSQALSATGSVRAGVTLNALLGAHTSTGAGTLPVLGSGNALELDDTLLSAFHPILLRKLLGSSATPHVPGNPLTPHARGNSVTVH